MVVTELDHRTRQLKELNLLPSFLLTPFTFLASSNNRGDVIITPHLSLADYVHMFNLPTDDMVQYWLISFDCFRLDFFSSFP